MLCTVTASGKVTDMVNFKFLDGSKHTEHYVCNFKLRKPLGTALTCVPDCRRRCVAEESTGRAHCQWDGIGTERGDKHWGWDSNLPPPLRVCTPRTGPGPTPGMLWLQWGKQ